MSNPSRVSEELAKILYEAAADHSFGPSGPFRPTWEQQKNDMTEKPSPVFVYYLELAGKAIEAIAPRLRAEGLREAADELMGGWFPNKDSREFEWASAKAQRFREMADALSPPPAPETK